jgi:hypothetical protein
VDEARVQVARTLADALVLMHLGWILFLIFGALAGRRWPWVKWLHLSGLAFALVLTAAGWICPLTHLEVALRGSGPGAGGGYPGSFLGHYAERWVYPGAPQGSILLGLLGIVGLSAWAYAGTWGRSDTGE